MHIAYHHLRSDPHQQQQQHAHCIPPSPVRPTSMAAKCTNPHTAVSKYVKDFMIF